MNLRRHPLASLLVAVATLALLDLATPLPAAADGLHPDALEPHVDGWAGTHAHGVPQAEEPPPTDGMDETAEIEGEAAAAGEADDEAWDVMSPPGPSFEVPIDTTEGTWMSLTVSPDDQEVVFDLLGDLYSVPIEGGTARALTSGIAWDMQPTFSPDGRSIAFTSDRAGGDNVWIVDRDGGEPRQVTEETFRLVNSPAWTPDGEYLAVRKHFTATRSLGAGEIWLYHRSGGGGLQMVEKANDQKDLGEPAFSPDGQYLYYSQDTTPGPVFEYNKDPNPGIYSVLRLDRETGDTETILSGPGGAARPTPSPDGRHLAFVRKVRGQSILHVLDLDSGESWPVYDELDRDMQETWAIHGVYPAMDWTSDSRSLVFWAGGKLHRLDVASQVVSEIPFHVADRRTVAEPVRFPVDVHPEQFEVKMLRWVQVAPRGDRAVFSALGRIWVRDLPDGGVRALTGSATPERFEYFPSISRDGAWVVYVTWDDEELGSVRVAPIDGAGPGRTLTTAPGHYVEPVFTPDGRSVVYRKTGGGYLTSPLWSMETGIYVVPVSGGGEPEMVTDSGVDPHFGTDPDRVYLTRFADGKRVLASVGLDGTEPREHLASDNADRFRVSPDGRWVAFQERFNAYVAAFPATGQRVAIGPKTSAVPVSRISRDAGDYLHWSGDSETLYWTLGPELFARSLSDAFAFVEGAPEELPEPPTRGLPIGFSHPSARPESTLALVGGTVVTMDDDRGEDDVIDDGVVVIRNHRIAAVGPRSEVQIPAGAQVIDTTGKTLIPGLVDVHWHGGQGSGGIIPEQSWVNLASLAFGVTTFHDPSNDTETVFTAAEMARAGLILAPRIFSTGTILYGAETPFRAVIESPEDAQSHLRRMEAVGAISVKSYNQPRRDQRQQVIAGAREVGIMVVPEGGSLFHHNMTMVVDGHTGIEHSIPVGAIYDDVRQLWGGTPGVGYTPTLVVGYGGIWGENYWYAESNVWENERLLAFVPREIVDARSRRRITAPDEEWGHFQNARVAAELQDEGVPVLLGAHGQREGLAAHWEMWMFQQGGMTPMEALRAGTIDAAWYLGLDGDVGSLEPGKLADVVILSADPLENIRNTASVEQVVLNGRLYDAGTLDQVAPESVERPPLFWQRGEDGRLLVAPGR